MVFEGTTGLYERLYRFNSRWVLRKKEKYGNSKKWIWRIFSLFLRSNLSNDDKRPGLKTGVELHFWVWNRVRIWRTGGTPSPRIHRSTPLGCVAKTADRINRQRMNNTCFCRKKCDLPWERKNIVLWSDFRSCHSICSLIGPEYVKPWILSLTTN